MKKHLKYFAAAVLLFFTIPLSIHAQDKEVIEQLKNIESGNIEEAKDALADLKAKYKGNSSVMFLDAVLKTNGQEALEIYETIYEKAPKSFFADAALYRMFSYYYSTGLYKKAESTLNKLKSEYPASPYIKAADRTIPEEIPAEAPPAAKQEKQTPKESSGEKFTVQAGAFLNIQNAQSLKTSLEADGFYSEITTKEVGGTMLNVVLAGKFSSEKKADSLIVHLEKKYRLKGRIVPIIK
jgi:tetratricopeptide (TPR) repeat protein